MNLDVADVFDAVRRQRIEPSGRRQRRNKCPAVEQDVALAIAADEMAESHGVVDGRPAVGVDRHGIADGDASVEHAHPIIFEDQGVVFRRGDDSVEFGRPGPGFVHDQLSAPAFRGGAGPDASPLTSWA